MTIRATVMQRPTTQFLSDVSLTGRHWNVREAVTEGVSVPFVEPHVVDLVHRRGQDDLETYFAPSFRTTMPDPSSFLDMDAAASTVIEAISSGRRIGIVGDYDVDGATSVAILTRFLGKALGGDVVWRIPLRLKDGYGLNDEIVDEMKAAKVDVLMVVDNGTTAVDSVARARSLDMDVVILDHHEAGSRLPDAILVNPKRPDGNGEHTYLCTAGLAFLFVVAVKRALKGNLVADAFDTRQLLGLVALGTVCDIVPLVGLNRTYVMAGLGRMNEIMGIEVLGEITRRTAETAYSTYTCGFVFGPALNAAGRLDDMSIGTKLLITDDHAEAVAIANRLNDLNVQRRSMQDEAVAVAKELYPAGAQIPPVIVAYDPAWHPGIVGLVAAKVRDAFDRPTIIIGEGGKGSCRTVPGFDIGRPVIEAYERGILLKGGGHAAAAGVTIDVTDGSSKVDDLSAFMAEKARGFVQPPLNIDIVRECGTVDAPLFKAYEAMAPFGKDNEKPVVALIGGVVKDVKTFKAHVKAYLTKNGRVTEVMFFGATGTALGDILVRSKGRRLDVVGEPDVNSFNGNETGYIKAIDAMMEREAP